MKIQAVCGLILSIFCPALQAVTTAPMVQSYYDAPYNVPATPYFSTAWAPTVSAAVADWWTKYKAYWGVSSCTYTQTMSSPLPPYSGSIVRIGTVTLKNGCGGGGPINATVIASKCPDRFVRDTTKAATAPDACYLPEAPDADRQKGDPPCGGSTNKPVNIATGNEHLTVTDYVGGVGGLLSFTRTYNSGGSKEDAGLGFRWAIGASPRLRALRLATGGHAVKATRSDGKVLSFVSDASGALISIDKDINLALTKLVDGAGNVTQWELRNPRSGDVELYDTDGRLTQRNKRNGTSQTLAYNSAGLLSLITDSFGGQLSFTWNANNRISSITTPGGVIAYGYSAAGNLTSVTHPDQSTITYLYENTAFPNALTGIIDAKNVRWATITYDTSGRAMQTKLAGNVEQITLTYNADGSVKVSDSGGMEWTHLFELRNGVKMPSGKSHPTIGTCAAAAQSTTYDANGNVSERADFNGNVTTYVYDLARNLETSRTEAAGTPQARTFTTQWHATWNLPAQVSEPGRVTVYTYDANGNRDSKTVTDTATNQTQAWAWTYNSVGQLLTEDGPRTDVSDITTYAYYDNTSPHYGRLYRITNAAGQITEFMDYNANGKVLSQVDPNGITTTFTYDARDRLKTRSSNGKTTSYDYDPVGQLTQVTLPDGNWVSYVYDDAHRLTEIHDKAGNRIVYTLDLMSRRTKEEIKDTQGGFATLLEWIRQSLAANTAPTAPH